MSSNTTDLSQPLTTKFGSRMDGKFQSGEQHKRWSGSECLEPVGHQFGMVQIVSRKFRRTSGFRELLMRCVGCGTERWISYDNLRAGKTRGCQSCSQKCGAPKWLLKRMEAARQRCTNPKETGYHRYGGRGIEFRFESVKAAAVWVVQHLGVHRDMEIDRINNDGHYEPGNLRYAPRKIQMANRRQSKVCAFHQFRQDHPEIRYADSTLRTLLYRGLTPEEIIARYHRKSDKPKGVYGTCSTADLDIVSLLPGN